MITPPPSESNSGERPPKKVLLVEDEPIVRKSIVRQLQHIGFEVTAVGSGAEALQVVASDLPEIVLSDLAMPGMDGVTLARRLRAEHSTLPIVIMSGHVPENLLPQFAVLKLAQLDKPFGEKELKEILAGLLG